MMYACTGQGSDVWAEGLQVLRLSVAHGLGHDYYICHYYYYYYY